MVTVVLLAMTKPITPAEVASQTKELPKEVIQAFNTLIVENWDGRSAVVRQDDAVSLVLTLMPGTTSEQIFARRWMDVERHYEDVGWSVEYDKPAYCESYPATFTFKKKRSK